MVPKSLSLSLSSPSPPPTAPPPTPLPPLPAAGRVISSISLQHISFTSAQPHPEFLRRRARATLIDVWRRHIISAFTPQHLPAAGYAEWTLIAMASKLQAEIDSIKAERFRSHGFGLSSKRTGGSKHRRTQSEGRNALDFGDRNDDYGPVRRRAPSPFPGVLGAEDTDRVVYPRRERGKKVLYLQNMHLVNVAADEWGVRYVGHPRSFDETDIFAVEFSGQNDSLLGEHFTVGDDWDDNERLTFELNRVGDSVRSSSGDRHLHPTDFGLDWNDDDDSRLADTAFDMSRTPLVPSDINDDESDDSQVSLRTPEGGEELPLAPPAHMLQGSTQLAIHSAPQPPSVSRVTSSRPRSRNASAQFSSAPSTPGQASHPPSFFIPPSVSVHDPDSRYAQVDEDIYSRYEYLERICTALEIVRSRAHSEGWRVVRPTKIGAKNDWMDAETERSLEIKAKRRAWSSGIRIYAPYSSTSHSARRVWDGSLSTFRSPMSPPGLTSPSRGIPRVRGPIVPTGLSLGIPVRSSPLAMYSWSADRGQTSTPSKYGILNSVHGMETIEGKRSSRVTFADSVTKLFPVHEDDSEDSLEPVQEVNAIGFPQAVPLAVSVDESEVVEGSADNEDDPFCFYPSRPRTRTTSMYMIAPTPSSPSSPVLPMFRPSTPPPSYQAAVGGNIADDEEGRLDASALLLQPLSSLSISSSLQLRSSRPPLTSNPPFVPRPRAVSLPTTRPCSSTNKTRRTSFHHKDEHCEDLSRAYASPPPEGPLVVSAAPAPHEQYPRYAHVHSPIPSSKKIHASISGRTGKGVVFEQAGSEFTVGIEVALGRAEEGRVIW